MSPLDFALEYIGRGWAVVPVPFKSKRPAGDAWQNLRVTEADARQWFNGQAQNVGVLMGAVSGDLADIDLDCAEAIAVAPFFLPGTRTFGRASKRCSHWLYKTELAAIEDVATIKFTDTQKPAKVILEIRIGGGGKAAQTVFPGSVHPSSEAIEWEDRREVATIEGAELKRICGRLAACALIARTYPQQGGRHEGAIIVAGWPAFLASQSRFHQYRILFKAGVKWWPDKDFEAKHIKPEQEARFVADPWEEKIAAHIQNLSRVTVGMVAKDALSIETARISMRDSYRIIDVLTSLGWTMTRSNGARWYKPRDSAA